MRFPVLPAILASLVLLPAACGPLPQPFRGNPGQEGRRLAAPPAYRLAVPAPTEALLTENDGTVFAEALAAALGTAEVPATAGPPLPLDWRLAVRAQQDGRVVTPAYAVTDADGREIGAARGAPVPVAAWARGDAAALRGAAERDAPAIVALLTRADAARRSTDAAALVAGGPPRLRLHSVRGAPGDGDRALTARMTEFLGNRGFLVQDQAEGAGFALQGLVEAHPVPGGKQRVEIQWIVTRRDGEELGRAVQLNEVPAGTLSRFWGDVAYVVAEEAAQAVRDIVSNAGGFSAAGQAAAGQGAAVPASATVAPGGARPGQAAPSATGRAGPPPGR